MDQVFGPKMCTLDTSSCFHLHHSNKPKTVIDLFRLVLPFFAVFTRVGQVLVLYRGTPGDLASGTTGQEGLEEVDNMS